MKTLSTCIRNAGSEFTNVLTLFLLLLLNSGILVDFIFFFVSFCIFQILYYVLLFHNKNFS